MFFFFNAPEASFEPFHKISFLNSELLIPSPPHFFRSGELVHKELRRLRFLYFWLLVTDRRSESRSYRNAINFDENIFRKSGNFHCCPCRFVLAKDGTVDSVHSCKVVHRLEEYLSFIKFNSPTSSSNQRPSSTTDRQLTVVFTTLSKELPLASTTALKFLSTCVICASNPPSTTSIEVGVSGMHPETNTNPFALMACW